MEIYGHAILSDNNRTAISMAGISYQIHGMARKQCAFSDQKAGKDHFCLKLGL